MGERIDLNAAEIGDLRHHPLSLLHTADWSMSWQESVLIQAAQLSGLAQCWNDAVNAIAERLKINDDLQTPARLQALSALVTALVDCVGRDLAFAFSPNARATLDAIAQVETLVTQFIQETAQLSGPYDRKQLLQANLDPAQQLWKKASQAWWLPRVLGARKCRQYLNTAVGAPANADPARDLPILARLQALNTQLDALSPLVQNVAGWQHWDSDTGKMQSAGRAAQRLRAAMSALADSPDALVNLRTEVEKLVVDANDMLAPEAPLGASLHDYQGVESMFTESLAAFAKLAGQTPQILLNQPQCLVALSGLAGQIQSSKQKLNAWCAWRRAREQAVALGLQPIITALEEGQIAIGAARESIQINYARWWAAQAIDGNPVLRGFVSVEHERKIQNFRELDAQVRQITAESIRTRIRSKLVEKDDAKSSSEFGLIRRELEKKTRHKPLRQLISEAPTAIPTMTPCLLMSPLSIAQYLPANQQAFDLVIFDEASQITVWDAIGAIARGKQTIVVGDPKQLPPTNFFSSGQQGEEDIQDEEDLESILDEMLGANLPTINLSWHYRSRHESLITFSNHRYYKGGLVTFPSPVTQDTAVSLQFIGGTYDRGGSQTNRAEADAIVAEIEQRLLDPATSAQTLGVVTFNQKQQTLILDLLDAARRRNHELDRFFAEGLIEPVFVKNLESVQGDERDVILFSTTFGPDMTGRVSMNFGPLNKNGGERRLNVAITRARIALKVFSSLRPEHIDLSRTAALGVRDLKHFLEFADKGVGALAAAVHGSQGDFESPLESAVASDLRERGWILHPQVGVSQFRIDLGVVDPDAPGRYLAGLECDGATYHRSATARDRDLVRESILRGLGWEILRLWSTDYWLDPIGIIDKLDAQLKQLHAKQQARTAALNAKMALPQAPQTLTPEVEMQA